MDLSEGSGGLINETDYSLCRSRRRNSGLVVEKRLAQAQDLILLKEEGHPTGNQVLEETTASHAARRGS